MSISIVQERCAKCGHDIFQRESGEWASVPGEQKSTTMCIHGDKADPDGHVPVDSLTGRRVAGTTNKQSFVGIVTGTGSKPGKPASVHVKTWHTLRGPSGRTYHTVHVYDVNTLTFLD